MNINGSLCKCKGKSWCQQVQGNITTRSLLDLLLKSLGGTLENPMGLQLHVCFSVYSENCLHNVVQVPKVFV